MSTFPAALDRFTDALSSFPPPGMGDGCNLRILGAANHGVRAGLDPDEIFQRIRAAVPAGRRRVTDGEIIRAVDKALRDHRRGSWTPTPRPAPVVPNGEAALRNIIRQGTTSEEADLWESSPFRLWGEPRHDPAVLMKALYEPGDYIFIGERHDAGVIGETVRTRDEWLSHFQAGGKTAPHFIINPLTGRPAPTRDGERETLRGDGCVAFRYALVEFDHLTRQDQFRFWTAIRLPIVALIDSGGKSIHGLLDAQKIAQAKTLEEWTHHIRNRLYDQILKPLGVDMACSNPARLSRLPGHFREEKRSHQRIVWLSRGGGG